MKHKSFLILFMFLSTALLSGCWDREELQQLNIVSAIGIDKGSDNTNNRYRATVQIVNAPQISGGQQGGKVQAAPVTSYSATGSTISEALRKISSKTNGELFFPHVQLLVIGEKMAKEGIQDLFDIIERDSQFRVLFPVLVVRDNTAKNILQITTPLAPIPAAKIVNALEVTKKVWGEYASNRADQVIQHLGGGGVGIIGVEITGNLKHGNKTTNMQQISPDTQIEIKGLALFKDGKLKKWLDEDAARGVTWVNNEIKNTVMNLDCKKKKDEIAVEVMRSNSHIKAKIVNNKPIIDITVRTEGHVSETHCPIDLGTYKTIEQLEEQMNKEIKDEILAAIKVAQKQKSDIFGFSEYVNFADKKLWKQIKTKWEDEIFPKTEVNVNVQAFIRRTGMRTKPYLQE